MCSALLPLVLCLCFSFSSRLIVLVELACVEEVGSLEASLSETSVLVGGRPRHSQRSEGVSQRRSWSCHQGGFWVVLSRQVGGCAVKAVLCYQGEVLGTCYQGKFRGRAVKAGTGVLLSRQVHFKSCSGLRRQGKVWGRAIKASAVKACPGL